MIIKQEQKNQKGVVLAVSLIVLLLVTILAMSGMRTTVMEERMASNSRNSNLSFQRAETALRAAEDKLDSAANNAPTARSRANGQANNVYGFSGASGSACLVSLNSLNFNSANTWSSGSNACTYDAGGNLDADSHKYYIEFLFASGGGGATR